MSSLILLVEDNAPIAAANARMLERRGYAVMTALTLTQARDCMARARPDAIVLDIMLPDGSGLDFMAEVRRSAHIPILLLTGLGDPRDIVRGLDAGGDDYLTKPYDFAVLLARVEALLRRAGRMPEIVTLGPLRLEILASRAFLSGADLRLTQKDFALLLLFTQNEGRALPAGLLYEKVWQSPMNSDTQAVKSAISRLRKKLGGSGYTIASSRGVGYALVQE